MASLADDGPSTEHSRLAPHPVGRWCQPHTVCGAPFAYHACAVAASGSWQGSVLVPLFYDQATSPLTMLRIAWLQDQDRYFPGILNSNAVTGAPHVYTDIPLPGIESPRRERKHKRRRKQRMQKLLRVKSERRQVYGGHTCAGLVIAASCLTVCGCVCVCVCVGVCAPLLQVPKEGRDIPWATPFVGRVLCSCGSGCDRRGRRRWYAVHAVARGY